MKKYFAAAAAALCAVSFAACGASEAEGENAADTGVYTEISESDTETSAATDTPASASEVLSDTQPDDEIAAPACADITAEILESVEFPSMAEVGHDRVGIYLDCEIPESCDFSMYICGSGGFADEVCVINGDDLDGDAFEAAVSKRIESRKKDFEGYNPDEYDKLEEYYYAFKDGYYMYAVTADNDVCAGIFEEYVK